MVAEAVPVRVQIGSVGTDLAEGVATLEFDVGSQRVRKLERVSASWADVVFAICGNTQFELKSVDTSVQSRVLLKLYVHSESHHDIN